MPRGGGAVGADDGGGGFLVPEALQRRPRVAHYSPVAFGADGTFGGGERYPVSLAKAMAELTDTVYVTFSASGSEVHERVGRLDTVKLANKNPLSKHPLNAFSRSLLPILERVDVLHIHQWDTFGAQVIALLAKRHGVRVFATDHGGRTRNLRKVAPVDRLLDGFLPVSAFGASFFPSLQNRSSPVFGGIDLADFAVSTYDERSDDALFVGRLMPHKGVDVLIESLTPDQSLRVVGRPQSLEFLDELKRLAHGKRVEFVVDADDDDIRAEYRRAKVAILPSLHAPPRGPGAPKAELLGLTLIEAMATGTPVVYTRTGGMPEVGEDGVTGIAVTALDMAALGAAVSQIATMPEEPWTTMSRAARRRVEQHFTWKAVAERCLAAYTSPV